MKNFSTLFTFLLLLTATLQLTAQRYLTEVFDDVTVTTDHVYGVNATILLLGLAGEALPEELKFDFYEPTGDTAEERPLILMFHTGSFLPIQLNQTVLGSRTDSTVVEMANRLAKMGYVVAMVDYRLGWNPAAETQPERALGLLQAAYRGFQDGHTAVRYFKKSYEEGNPFAIDTSKVAVWGVGTGGYIALGMAFFDKYSEIATTEFPPGKFLTDIDGDPSTLEPMVLLPINGDLEAKTVGVMPDPPLPPFPIGDTLCYPNLPEYSSEVHLCVNIAGAIGDLSWLEEGDMPVINFHVPSDPFTPYESGVLTVVATLDPIVEVQGGKLIAEKADDLGNNASFYTIEEEDDPYRQAAMEASAKAGHDYFEGLYPFNRPTNEHGNDEGDPWTWWEPAIWDAIPHPLGGTFHSEGLQNNADMSPEKARMYIDTIIGYFAPRAFRALDLTPVSEPILKEHHITVNVAPNPATASTFISTAAEKQILDVELLNMQGQSVLQYLHINHNQVRVDRENLPAGLYLVKLRFEEGVLTKKLIFR